MREEGLPIPISFNPLVSWCSPNSCQVPGGFWDPHSVSGTSSTLEEGVET